MVALARGLSLRSAPTPATCFFSAGGACEVDRFYALYIGVLVSAYDTTTHYIGHYTGTAPKRARLAKGQPRQPPRPPESIKKRLVSMKEGVTAYRKLIQKNQGQAKQNTRSSIKKQGVASQKSLSIKENLIFSRYSYYDNLR